MQYKDEGRNGVGPQQVYDNESNNAKLLLLNGPISRFLEAKSLLLQRFYTKSEALLYSMSCLALHARLLEAGCNDRLRNSHKGWGEEYLVNLEKA